MMEIDCKFEDVRWMLLAPKSIYTCSVTACNVTTRGTVVAAFKGRHEAMRDKNSVTALRFNDTDVHFIPRNLSKIFPNLLYLAIRNCGLKEVFAEDMTGSEKLEVFWVQSNKITTLPVDLFKHMPNLKEASFNNNLIQKFDVKILEPIRNTIESFCIKNNSGIGDTFEKKEGSIEDFMKRMKQLEADKENAASFEMMTKQFENLFMTGKHSDFTIKVREKEYRVHKCILASQSSVFDKMFSDDDENVTKTFNKIKNFSQAAFEEFLSHFYNKIIPSEENAIDLLELAVEFDVPGLKRQCKAIVCKTISPANAHQRYNFAVQYSLQALKRAAFEVVKQNHPEIAEYLFNKPEVVNAIIEAKNEFQANHGQNEERLIE